MLQPQLSAMLAKAPLNVSETIKFRANNFKKSPSFLGHGRDCCNFRGTCKFQWKKTRVSVRASAGYTRKPLETAGAYELIDEETGEKVIVWGGTEADDASIPSKEVLSWKPKGRGGGKSNASDTRNTAQGVEPSSSVIDDGEDSTELRKDLPGSFARLKAQKIRALSRKVSHVKKEKFGNEDSHLEDDPSRRLDNSDSEPRYMVKGTILDSLRRRQSISRASKAQDFRDKTGGTDSSLSSKGSRINDNLDLKKTFEKPHEHDMGMDKEDVSVPAAAVNAPLRQWDSGVRTQNSRFDSKNILRQHRKLSSDSGFFSKKSFKDLGCSEDIIESLKGQSFFRPSHIQSMAFASALEGKSCIIADQSGSGKTLAYLAPVIQRLRQEELNGVGKSSSKSPRVVILVPTAELGSQVLSNCRSMSRFGVPFRSMVATGGFRQKTQLESLQQDLDVLIATPGRFMFLLKEGFLQLANLRCAVLDEVDILFGDEDFEQVLQILVTSAPVITQYLFVTATLPVDIYNKLVELFPDCEVIMGPGMHRTSSGLEEVLVDCSGDDGMEKTPETAFLNKKSALLQLVDESPVSKTIIFCNKIETCRKVENVLKRLDRKEAQIRVLPFHSALAQQSRLENMKEFLSPQSKGDSLILICTDRASRGIDFTGVNHVVLFDFPRDPSEYVRRVGRTARGAGGKGKAFVFVVGKQVSLARRIIERNKKGHPLHDVPSRMDW